MWLTAFIVASLVSIALSHKATANVPIRFLYPDDAYNHMNFTTKCFGDLGCFYTGPPWYHPLYRPLTATPQELHTKFLLYTRSNKEEPYYLEPTEESLAKSPFEYDSPIKVLAHGLGAEPDVFLGSMKELLEYSDYNVILIDWSIEASSGVAQTLANARLVGAYTAKLLNFLMEQTGLEPGDIHLIGHSLGGHLISYVGDRIDNLARLTGLDIAGPYYDHAPKEVRLDRSDAKFVDIIQTNKGRNFFDGSSLDEMVGHAVFTPNGGNRQPRCPYSNTTRPRGTFLQTAGRVCSHRSSIEYFQSSINTCRYTSYACIAYRAFEEDACNNTPFTNRMGFHAVKPPYQLNYYLDTEGTAPYCEVK